MTLLAAVVLFAALQSPDPRRTARDLWLQGMDREAEFRLDSALKLFRQSVRTDAEFLPAHLSYMFLAQMEGRSLKLRAEYDRAGSESPINQCLATIAWGISGHDLPEAARRYRALIRDQGHTTCSEIARIWSGSDDEARPALLREAITRHGNAPTLTQAYVAAVRHRGEKDSRYRLYQSEIANAPTTALALGYRIHLIGEMEASGDTRAALAELTRTTNAFAKDTRPFIRFTLLLAERVGPNDPAFLARINSNSREMRTLARRNGATGFEFDALMRNAGQHLDHGDLRAAEGFLNEAVEIADRANSAQFRLLSYLQRGRARAAQGKQASAIADLKVAQRAAILLGERYRLADTYHQMAHAYEARANWPAAMAAVDSFVRVGGTARDRAMRMIRLNDAGAIYWKAGFHARANAFYQEMVRTIDTDSWHYEYAGAYFERIGDLPRAAQYYRKVFEGEWKQLSPGKLAFAGLTRIYEELGMVDSAIASARKHDAMVVTPEREILLPNLLARHGQVSEAVILADRWADLQRRRGNPAAYAAAINQQAELALATDPARTMLLVARSDSVARQVNSIADLIAARRLRGLAKAKLGNVDGGVRDILAALSMSDSAQSVFLPVTLNTDVANLMARAGRSERALYWYARADAVLNAASRNFDDPVVIAQFRSARRALFDGAVRTALSLSSSARSRALLEWSQRKKGRTSPGTQPLRLAGRERAVLDYLTVGDTIIATVVAPNGATTRLLPVSLRATAGRAERLIAPMRETRNGRLDISRAEYSTDIARILYDALLRPLEDLIGSATSLTIVPDVPLQAVPFDALVSRVPKPAHARTAYSDAVYAADKWRIEFAPTVQSALMDPVAGALAGRRLVFVSHAAPGVDRERAAILAAWPRTGVLELTGNRATESGLHGAHSGQVVHFATHAISDDVDPLRSHLVLRRAGGDDGLLHSNEIRRTSWSRSLVFLAACETATGPMFSGTGTMSLARAFLDGGASSVIATQWPVGDVSAAIAGKFYRELARGESAPDALHRAKLDVRSDPRTSHPFFWASHILIIGSP